MDEQKQPLRIESMSLTNFRGIASVDIDFHPQLTLIAGRNGVGKTSLLDAMAATLDSLRRLNPNNGGGIFRFDKPAQRINVSEKHRCDIRFSSVSRALSAATGGHNDFFVALINPNIGNKFPFTVYYSQERAVSNSAPHRESDIFLNSLSAAPQAVGAFKHWFFDKEADEGSEIRDSGDIEFRNPELEAIRKVVVSIDGIDGITSRAHKGQERDLYFVKSNNRISIDQLSSGERVYFILAADLARRLIVAFPEETIQTASGFVLIDEIELHLHPAWQRKIIKQLQETFPNCQFIITTHSPQVVGGVGAECVRLLSADEEGNVSVKTPSASYGRDSNYILEALLDADERVGEVDDLIDAARDAIDQGNFGGATDLLNSLETTIEGDAPIVNILRARLRRLQGNVERAS